MTNEPASRREAGRSRRRIEDDRFLRGLGCYVDDLPTTGQLFGHVLRSPMAHARIVAIDEVAARALPGVAAIFTSADLRAADIGPLPCTAQIASVEPLAVPPRYALAHERVRHVGDPVAFVVADSAEVARDAAEAVEIVYEDLPAIVELRAARAADAPQVWLSAPGNLAFRYIRGDEQAVRAAFARAATIVQIDLDNNRLVAAPLEPRGAIGHYDRKAGRFLLTLSGQGVHEIRDQLADVFRVPRDRLDVMAPDVGGGFGPKNVPYPEYVLVLFAARALRRDVRWMSDRSEDFVSSAHARANRSRARLALDEKARFLALDVETLADMGAYLSALGPAVPTTSAANALGGVYAIPAAHLRVEGAYTNTVPVDAYRGAGKPEVNYLIERLVDLAARRLAIDPWELRRRNMIRRFPYTTGLGIVVEEGRFTANLDRAAEIADLDGFACRREAAASRGKLAGRGVACFLETSRGAPGEWARVRCGPEGLITLFVGTQSNGQGHETSFPQIAADRLGLPLETFRYVQADTRLIDRGRGHGGARSLYQGGTALLAALEEMLGHARALAARLLQVPAEQLVFAEGAFVSPGGEGRLTLARLATAASDPEQMSGEAADGLVGEAETTCDAITFPNGCHVAEVEIDRETGEVALTRYVAVDDYGMLINPALAEGQVQGGIAQGIGQALFEHTAYDPDSGQLLAGSFMDYRLPRAADLPDLQIVFDGLPTKANPLGVKGAGQAGAIAAPQVVVNALLDALAPFGVDHLDMPVTSDKIWRALRDGPTV